MMMMIIIIIKFLVCRLH